MDQIADKIVDGVDNTAGGAQGSETIDYEALYRQASESLVELTAERDSLLSENTELRAAKEAAIADSAKTKEINYTLARQLDLTAEKQKTPEELMASMFLRKGEK